MIGYRLRAPDERAAPPGVVPAVPPAQHPAHPHDREFMLVGGRTKCEQRMRTAKTPII